MNSINKHCAKKNYWVINEYNKVAEQKNQYTEISGISIH